MSESATQADQSAERARLRRELRAARRGVPDFERQGAERQIFHALMSLMTVRRAELIALYLADDGEPDLALTIGALEQQDVPMAVPGLANKSMDFRPYRPGDVMQLGDFDMIEPATEERIAAGQLAVVLNPLVGFDLVGNRIGRGAGFYDRVFGPLEETATRPIRIGVAFEVQRVASLPCAAHDVPLDAVVTEAGIRWFR